MSKVVNGNSKGGKCCGPRCCGITSLIFAIFFAVMAAILPFMVSNIIDKEMRLVPGTIMYDFWEESPVPMYIRFYMYNVTNPDEVVKQKAKPIVQELGPYTYTETHSRVNLEPHPENYTLKFQETRQWHYRPDMSNGSLDDLITNLNVPLLSAAYSIRFSPAFIKIGFNQFINQVGSEVFITKTVNELLFEGYSDPLLDFAGNIPPSLNISIPAGYDKFGWFYNRNNSELYDGTFSIFTGEDDISKLLEMDMWNNMRQTEFYESYCGMINGSFGEGWPPRRERTSISLYSTDLCRSITLDYTEDVSKDGVTFYRFEGTKKMFASVEENPDNWCFCSGGTCNPSGVVNSSVCRYGSPAFVSFPHYYLADPFFQNQVEGLYPQADLHKTHVDLEPRTAVPLNVAVRLQINIQLQPINGISVVANVPEVYLPVMWFGVTAELSDKLLKTIKFSLNGPIIGSICFFVSFVCCLVGVAVSGVKYSRRKALETTLPPETSLDKRDE